MSAAGLGYEETVKILLLHKAGVNSINNDGGTPLHFAAGRGHKEIVDLLRR